MLSRRTMPFTALPDIMTAYRLIPGSPDPVRQEIPVPTLAPDHVLVRVLAAGVCHSDLGILDTNSPLSKFMTSPFTMGHEGAGMYSYLTTSSVAQILCQARLSRSVRPP